jgi:hypothetical protein
VVMQSLPALGRPRERKRKSNGDTLHSPIVDRTDQGNWRFGMKVLWRVANTARRTVVQIQCLETVLEGLE